MYEEGVSSKECVKVLLEGVAERLILRLVNKRLLRRSPSARSPQNPGFSCENWKLVLSCPQL